LGAGKWTLPPIGTRRCKMTRPRTQGRYAAARWLPSPTQSTSTPTPSILMGQCTSLGAQFDKAEAMHKNAKNYKEALGLRSEGKSLCTAHRQADGIKKIESALAMIGVKPMVKS
jgi:hypothetical protein